MVSGVENSIFHSFSTEFLIYISLVERRAISKLCRKDQRVILNDL
jgi:hypothetical protein